ncbi:MAG: hypothetical protein ACPGPE_15425, partial [Planctomycetota bacterium]
MLSLPERPGANARLEAHQEDAAPGPRPDPRTGRRGGGPIPQGPKGPLVTHVPTTEPGIAWFGNPGA